MDTLFKHGHFTATQAVADKMERSTEFRDFCMDSLNRHTKGDWGEVSEQDRAMNMSALDHGGRLFSGYPSPDGDRIWVITSADRSTTCIQFAYE